MKNNLSSIYAPYVIVAILLTIVAVLYILLGGQLNELKWNENPGGIAGELLIKITIIAALLDQVIFLIFPENYQVLNKAYLTIKDCNRKMELESFDRSELIKEMKKAEKKIVEENKKRLRKVQLVAFGVALFLSVSGVRILNEFIEISDSSIWGINLLSIFDVISTAALLSGGTSAVEMFFQIIRKNLKTRS